MCRIAGPYPFLSANILKLFADAQVFVVALVGLVLRMEEGMYGTTASFSWQRHASAARVDPAAGIGDLGLTRLRSSGR